MSNGEKKSGVLPTEPVTQEQKVVLVQSLLVTWNVLGHLQQHGIFKTQEDILKLRAEGCCKPDGGTCCVNKRIV
jgi:hypothetical protein